MTEILTIKGNRPAGPDYLTNWKVFDPYEARAVVNLIGTIADLVQDGDRDAARIGLRNLAIRFDTGSGDEPPYSPPLRPKARCKPAR